MHPFYVDKTSFSYARRIEALDEGFNVLMAVADTVKDSITLEKGYRSICGCSGIPFCIMRTQKSRLIFLNSTCLVVAGAGFEPTTFGL